MTGITKWFRLVYYLRCNTISSCSKQNSSTQCTYSISWK